MQGRLGFVVDEQGLTEFDRGLASAKKSSDDLGVKAVALGTILGNLGTKALEGAAGLAKMAVVAGVDLVGGFIDSTAALDTWARKMGTTTQELQRLEFAGASVGAEADNTREAFKTLTENLGELERVGSGPAVDSLATLGLTLADFEGKDATEQMGLFADAMQRLPNDAQRVSVALEVMGEDGGALLPLFQKGSQGIEELAGKADRLGLVLDEGAVRAAKDAKIALGEMAAQARAVGNSIAAKLAPKVTEVVGRIQGWYEQNQDIIDQKIGQFVEGLIPAFERTVEVVGKVIDVGTALVDMFGGLEHAMVAGATAAGLMAVAMGGIPGIMAAATAAIALGINELAGFSAEVRQLQREIDDGEARAKRAIGGIGAGEKLAQAQKEGRLGDLSEQQFKQGLEEFTAGLVAAGASEERIERSLSSFESAREQQVAPILARRQAEENERIERSDAIQKARGLEGELRKRLEARAKKKGIKTTPQAIESALALFRRGVTEGSDTATAAKAAADQIDTLGGRGGGAGKVNTRAAEDLLGAQIRALAEGAGASSTATQKAIEAAATSLKGGANQSVALQAATSTIESLTGQRLAAAGSPDAALFGALTQIGGASAARSATDGARFVRIDQSVNIDVGGVELAIPEGWAGAMTGEGMAAGTADALQRQLVERVFLPIVEQAQARGERP